MEFSKQLPRFYNGCEFDEKLINEMYSALMQCEHIIAKLMKSEHERWNAYHYLNGWTYGTKNKEQKVHNCLTNMESFNDVARRITIIYDLYSVLYIPSYLSSIGYEIVTLSIEQKGGASEKKKNNTITLGVTGHRNIDTNDHKLKENIENELEKIIENYDEVILYSPLAEGADRLFVDVAFGIAPEKMSKLLIPMPFDKERYMQDFKTEKSKHEFEKYFDESSFKNNNKLVIDSFSTLLGKDDESYKNVGKCVVDKSNILIALWDGKPANGIGGTGDIVTYAKKKRKAILHINTDTLEVNRINFEGIL